MCTQLVGGYLSHRFGGKRTLAVSCALWSVFTALTPLVAHNLASLIFCRIFLGLSEGVGFPSIMAIISAHIPANEHSRSIAFVLSGSYLGAVIAYLVSSNLIATEGYGWRSVFYIFGFLGLFWIIPWVLFEAPTVEHFTRMHVASSTAEHVELSDFVIAGKSGKSKNSNPSTPTKNSRNNSVQDLDDENSELWNNPSSSLGQSQTFSAPDILAREAREGKYNGMMKVEEIPWRKLLTTREVWAIIVVQFCQSWSYWLLINWLPTYYNDAFGVNIKSIGYFAGLRTFVFCLTIVLPYVVQGITGMLSGVFGDFLINKGYTKLFVRKFMQSFGMISMSIFMMLGVSISQNITQGMLFITVAMGVYCTTFAGVSVNHLDIAPNYAPIVYGIGNTAAQLPGIIGVWFTGLLLDVTDNNWGVVFSLASVISVTGAISWIFMAGADVVIH